MAPNQKSLKLYPGQLDAEALEQFARCLRHDTTGGLQSLDEMLGREAVQLFELRDGAEVAMRYALELVPHAHGRELVVLAAAGGAPGLDMTRLGMLAILHQARSVGADAVTVFTRRKGLVKKLAPLGFAAAGVELRKRLTPCN